MCWTFVNHIKTDVKTIYGFVTFGMSHASLGELPQIIKLFL